MTNTITNHSTTAVDEPPDVNAAMLAQLEGEAQRAGLDRLPRRGEGRDAFILTIARRRGAIAQDCHVADPRAMVAKLLKAAQSDELFAPGSPISKALIAGAAVWDRMNPEIEGVGNASPLSRTGIRRPVAHLVRELRDDPTRAQRLSQAEAQLLTLYAGDDLVEAVEAVSQAIEAARARVREAAEAELARPQYDNVRPDPEPPPAAEAVPLGRLTSRSALAPALTARDLRSR